ncbi:MAG: DUF4258 domain-containing protein [Betaproteobacteria bacterium]|nr:DUF4258 domain-containing protein [Betaproteobacteria bacterium]
MSGISAHAQARMQQRGINERVLDRLFEYGKVAHDHQGGEVIFINKQARRRLRTQLDGNEYRSLERYFNAYAVIAGDGEVVTVGRRWKRLPRE